MNRVPRQASLGYLRGPKAGPKVRTTTTWTKLINWEEVEDYRQLGWEIKPDALSGTHHAERAVIGCWRSNNPDATPPKPANA